MTIEYISLSGGGIRGLMYLGAFSALERHYNLMKKLDGIKGIAGTSVGALAGLGLLLGLSSADIKDVLFPIVSSIRNIAPTLDISLFISNYGLDDGDNLRNAIKNVLKRGGLSDESTLKDLKRLLKKDFICCTTNLNTRQCEYLTAETHEHLSVIDAVFMSMCVPFLFTPFEYKQNLYADGGLSSNLPECFPNDKTLFFTFDLKDRTNQINSWNEYLESVIACGIECQQIRTDLFIQNSECCVLRMPETLRNNSTLNLNIHQSTVRQFILCGYYSALAFTHHNFMSTMEAVLEFVISTLIEVHESDECSGLNY